MFAIGTWDEDSSRMRYVRDDSREDIVWSTSDPARAKRWPTREAAWRWACELAPAMHDRLMSQPRVFVPVSGDAEPFGPACDPETLDFDGSVSAGAYLACVGFDPSASVDNGAAEKAPTPKVVPKPERPSLFKSA